MDFVINFKLMKTSLLFLALFSVSNLFGQTSGNGVTDIDGNFYETVKIGTQEWMTKNLDVATFRNGDPIPEAKTDEEWKKAWEEGKPAWCYYDNDPANGKKYGKLYNWYAVNDSRGLAPHRYHIPSDKEWWKLINFLGGKSVAGAKMKSTSGWLSYPDKGSKTCSNCENWNAEYRSKVPCHTCKDTRSVPVPKITGTNSSGFSGLPGGDRDSNGSFLFLDHGARERHQGIWWSSTESEYGIKQYRYFLLWYFSGGVVRGDNAGNAGFSVRCLRD